MTTESDEKWATFYCKCCADLIKMNLSNCDRVRIMQMILDTHRIVSTSFFKEGMEWQKKISVDSKHGSEKTNADTGFQTRLSGGTTPMEVVQ